MLFWILFKLVTLNNEVEQGGVILGFVRDTGRIYFDGKRIKSNKKDSLYFFIIGVSYNATPGMHVLEFRNSFFTEKKKIWVKKKRFKVQYIKFSDKKKKLFKEEKIKEEREKIKEVLNAPSDTLYSIIPMYVPLHGRITSYYGVERKEGHRTLWHHSGIDIAAPYGTPVIACCDGKVVLSDYFTLQGNTVIIDHGCNLKTVYYHLSKRMAEEGDYIHAGDTIGFVGDTGLSTGPHLHFGVYVNGVPVDPIEWFKEKETWKEEFFH